MPYTPANNYSLAPNTLAGKAHNRDAGWGTYPKCNSN